MCMKPFNVETRTLCNLGAKAAQIVTKKRYYRKLIALNFSTICVHSGRILQTKKNAPCGLESKQKNALSMHVNYEQKKNHDDNLLKCVHFVLHKQKKGRFRGQFWYANAKLILIAHIRSMDPIP